MTKTDRDRSREWGKRRSRISKARGAESVGRWGAGWVGREAAGAGENFFERLGVAGVRGIGGSGWVEDWGFT